eukprot:scaffold53_cov193-Pinguiococcus_pyrenoidosus.AAC.37
MDELEKFLTGVSLLQEMTPRSLDHLVSFGERSSVRLVAAQLNRIGVPAQAFDSWDLGMLTTSDFGSAEILPEAYEKLGKSLRGLDENVVPVVTGFIGKDVDGRITTLGRGGSDLTASVLAKAGKLDEIQVWKDVDGIMSADPRSVAAAVPVEEVTYEEAAELAYFGAKVRGSSRASLSSRSGQAPKMAWPGLAWPGWRPKRNPIFEPSFRFAGAAPDLDDAGNGCRYSGASEEQLQPGSSRDGDPSNPGHEQFPLHGNHDQEGGADHRHCQHANARAVWFLVPRLPGLQRAQAVGGRGGDERSVGIADPRRGGGGSHRGGAGGSAEHLEGVAEEEQGHPVAGCQCGALLRGARCRV